MKKTIAAVLLATLLGGAGGYAWVAYQNRAVEAGLLSRLVTLEQQLSHDQDRTCSAIRPTPTT